MHKTIAFILTVLVGILGAYFIFQWHSLARHENQMALEKESILSSRGVKVNAEILGKKIYVNNDEPSKSNDGISRYEINYRFMIDGKKYERSALVTTKNPHDRIEVIYDPESPANNRCTAEEPTSPLNNRDAWLVVGVFAAVLVVLYYGLMNLFNRPNDLGFPDSDSWS